MDQTHQIGDYQVLSVLGQGASSTIYAVMDPRDSHVYAIKRVVRHTASDQRFIDQALNEHEIATQIEHPTLRRSFKIIRRRKLVKTTELLVLMELVDGMTLELGRPQSLEQSVMIFHAVAQGLDAMHAAGFVHCDIKPNNILIGSDAGVKIIDLGQACPIDTVKERIQGTPDYIAPEQVLRLSITPQTDVFNLGATMYWTLTSHHVPTLIPKKGEGSGLSLGDRELRPPAELNENIPTALNALILKCLEIERKDRPATMMDVKNRLEVVYHQLQQQKVNAGEAEERRPA